MSITVDYEALQKQYDLIGNLVRRTPWNLTDDEMGNVHGLSQLLEAIIEQEPFPQEEKKPPLIATKMITLVKSDRLRRATEALTNGQYTVTIASKSDEEIRGLVTNGDRKEY